MRESEGGREKERESKREGEREREKERERGRGRESIVKSTPHLPSYFYN